MDKFCKFEKIIFMSYSDYITTDPAIMVGKPIIKGTRITVELVIKKMGEGATVADLLKSYPHLKEEEILAAIQYAAAVLANEEILLLD